MSDITKRDISASLKKILCEKNLSKITVQDIADDCGINRQTFYYHFQDILSLYRSDISKIDRNYRSKVLSIFD